MFKANQFNRENKMIKELISEINSIIETDSTNLSIAEHTEIVIKLANLTGKLEMLLWVT